MPAQILVRFRVVAAALLDCLAMELTPLRCCGLDVIKPCGSRPQGTLLPTV
jgi:hypothetical protein